MPEGSRALRVLDRVVIRPDSIRQVAARVAARMEEVADELNTADGRLGDGDLGVTMMRGCRLVVEALDTLPDDVGMTLARCAQAFTKTSGSSFGTLVATGLMAAAKPTKDRTEVPLSEVPELIQLAVDSMIARGKASLGDKTVLDGLDAVRQALAALPADATAESVTNEATGAAQGALDAFRDRPNKIGRARIFGDKSVGLDDPGMLALVRVVEVL